MARQPWRKIDLPDVVVAVVPGLHLLQAALAVFEALGVNGRDNLPRGEVERVSVGSQAQFVDADRVVDEWPQIDGLAPASVAITERDEHVGAVRRGRRAIGGEYDEGLVRRDRGIRPAPLAGAERQQVRRLIRTVPERCAIELKMPPLASGGHEVQAAVAGDRGAEGGIP